MKLDEKLEGLEAGHPDNTKYIKLEKQFESENSFSVNEAATRDLAYKMASEAGYDKYFNLAYHLIYCTLIVTGISFYLVSRNAIGGEGAIVVGSLITMWSTAVGAVLAFICGSSIGSKSKGKAMARELKKDK